MHPTATHYVGCDVSKDTIAFRGITAANINNTASALRAYLASLPAPLHLICEATGRHYHLLRRVCADISVPLTVLNPMHARAFAKSLGKLEKTDALDALVLRLFGEQRRPAPSPPPCAGRQELLDILMVRNALVSDIADHRRRNQLLSPTGATLLEGTITALTGRLTQVDRQLDTWLASPLGAPYLDQVQTLCLVKGVGILSAVQLIGYLPELGQCNRRQIAKLAGLAPLPWQSGYLDASRRIQHGRAPARRVLYQCAVVAARWNETLKPQYQKLRARGMPAKPAYCAIARKLLVFLNAALRNHDCPAP